MLGDPRKLSGPDLVTYRKYADWIQKMESKYDIMTYRQDLQGYGEPAEGMWDGFQRINTESKQGGIIGIFRHGSPENSRLVTVSYLDPSKTYEVKSFEGSILASMTGEELQKKGFVVEIDDAYSGRLFEISIKE
jgi:alpha-galactosidase